MRLLASLLRQIPTWDTSSKVAIFLAFVLLPLLLALATWGPEQLQNPAKIGAVGLLITSQLIFLWGNRGMATPYTQAQREFIKGDFESARKILEAYLDEGKNDSDAYTLLANTYRHLGRLKESEATARHALMLRPDSHFAYYGLGGVLLAKGEYQDAVDAIQQALDLGASPVVEFDLGHAYYRLGEFEQAIGHLKAVKSTISEDEMYRKLMVVYILYQLEQQNPPTIELIEQGLPFWEASAMRFHDTSYGQALQDDVRHLQTWNKES